MKDEVGELDTTIDEWKAALEVPNDDKGQTIGEITEVTGVSESTVRRNLKRLIREGKCTKGTAIRNVDGCRCRWNVYQLIGEE